MGAEHSIIKTPLLCGGRHSTVTRFASCPLSRLALSPVNIGRSLPVSSLGSHLGLSSFSSISRSDYLFVLSSKSQGFRSRLRTSECSRDRAYPALEKLLRSYLLHDVSGDPTELVTTLHVRKQRCGTNNKRDSVFDKRSHGCNRLVA